MQSLDCRGSARHGIHARKEPGTGGPCRVRTAAETRGSERARTVTLGKRESQVTGYPPLRPRTAQEAGGGFEPHLHPGSCLPSSSQSSATPSQVKGARFRSHRSATPFDALDPGRGPRPEACQQPGRQDRASSVLFPPRRHRFATVNHGHSRPLDLGAPSKGVRQHEWSRWGRRFDSGGAYSGGGSGWLVPMDGGGMKSGCGPGLRFKHLANRSASWPRCQRRASRASWSSITQCQRPNRIRQLTRTGPSSAHTAVRRPGRGAPSPLAGRPGADRPPSPLAPGGHPRLQRLLHPGEGGRNRTSLSADRLRVMRSCARQQAPHDPRCPARGESTLILVLSYRPSSHHRTPGHRRRPSRSGHGCRAGSCSPRERHR